MADAKMRIGFDNSNKAWGGGEKWFAEIMEGLSEKFEIHAFVFPESPLYKRLQQSNVTLHALKIGRLSWLNPIAVFSLKRVLQKEEISFLIMNLPSDVKAIGTAAMLAGVRNRVYRRGSAILIRNSFLNRWLFKHVVTEIIANSQTTLETILQNNPKLFPREKIRVIHNGIDLKKFDQLQNTSKPDVKQPVLIIGNAGRLEHQKGQEYLIELASLLHKKGLDFVIKIAGTGRKYQDLEQLIQEKGLSSKVQLLGFVENIPAFMAQLDVYVHTAHWEGFGFVLVEAMAASKAVVAFDTSSNPEIIGRDGAGFLIPYPQLDLMADQIQLLAHDAALRMKAAAKARERVADQLTIDRVLYCFNDFITSLDENNG
jgi:glycosyltransferase involved in cell wall biosynthesis